MVSEAERYFSSLSVTGAFVAGSGLEKNAWNSAEKYDEIDIFWVETRHPLTWFYENGGKLGFNQQR